MNTMMTRRNLLCRTAPALAMIPIAFALDGCAGVTKAVGVIDSVTPQVIAWVGKIGQVAGLILPAVQAITGLGSTATSIIGTAETVLADIHAVGTSIASATGTGAVGLVSRLGAGLGTLAPLLSGIAGVPSIVSGFITNGLALLPAIEQAVGIISAPPAAAQHRFARMAAPISPEQAYQNLVAMAAGR